MWSEGPGNKQAVSMYNEWILKRKTQIILISTIIIIFSIINQIITDMNNSGIKMRLLKFNIVTRVGKFNICI